MHTTEVTLIALSSMKLEYISSSILKQPCSHFIAFVSDEKSMVKLGAIVLGHPVRSEAIKATGDDKRCVHHLLMLWITISIAKAVRKWYFESPEGNVVEQPKGYNKYCFRQGFLFSGRRENLRRILKMGWTTFVECLQPLDQTLVKCNSAFC